MQEIDNSSFEGNDDMHDDHELFMKRVVQGDHELLYLHTYLKEILGEEGTVARNTEVDLPMSE